VPTRTHTLKLRGSSEIAASIDSSPSKTSAGPENIFVINILRVEWTELQIEHIISRIIVQKSIK